MSKINPTVMNVINALLYIIMILAVLFIAIKLTMFLLPFVVAYIIFLFTKPLTMFLENKIRLNNNVANFISITLFFVLVFSIFGVLLYFFAFQIYYGITMLVDNSDSIKALIDRSIANTRDYLPENILEIIRGLIDSFLLKINSLSITVLTSIKNFITKIPSIMIIGVIIILSSYLMNKNQEKVIQMAKKQMPDIWIEKYVLIKKSVFDMIFSYLKAQIILIFICLVELLVLLNITNIFVTKVEFLYVIALITPLIDALPVLGSGTVLIPLAIFNLSISNFKLAISFIIIYIILLSVRQILEPRIISKSIKANPLLTLISMYAGYKMFGIIGFLLGPIYMMVLVILFRREIDYGFFKFIVEDVND